PAARFDVAREPPQEANVGRRVDEELDVDALAQLRLGEHEDAFDDDHLSRLDALRLFEIARMRGEFVHRHFHRRSFRQYIEMPNKQLGLQRIRMIEVDLMPLLGRVAVEITVVRVVRNPFDAVFADAIVDRTRNGGLARTRAAGDADDDGRLHGPDCSSNSFSVMNSETLSLPHVLHMTESSFPFGPNSN